MPGLLEVVSEGGSWACAGFACAHLDEACNVRADDGIQDRDGWYRGRAGLAWRANARRLEHREAMGNDIGEMEVSCRPQVAFKQYEDFRGQTNA